MMRESAAHVRRLSTMQSRGRVVNAISGFLRKQLSVPHIYQKPRIPGSSEIDVLAVDRGGSGDVHGVKILVRAILPTPSEIGDILASLKRDIVISLKDLPVHYRYLAINANPDTLSILSKLNSYSELFDRSGIGRYGILAYDQNLLQAGGALPSMPVSAVVEPERFRVRGAKLEALESFLDEVEPDMQVRV